MSSYRQIHSKIWKDDWFLELEPTNKLFFIYLFSNESASLAGIYELSIRVMSFESGLTMPEIRDAFKIFSDAQKAHYQDGVVWIHKLRKYHENSSPKVQTRILKDVKDLRDCELKHIYCDLYGIDRVSEESDTVSIPSYTYTSTITSTTTSKKAPKKPKKKAPQIDIPERLNTSEFKDVWCDYVDHRKEIKSPMTPRAANMQLKKLAVHTPGVAIAMIEQSIANGWKGIFALKQGVQPNGNGKPKYKPVIGGI